MRKPNRSPSCPTAHARTHDVCPVANPGAETAAARAKGGERPQEYRIIEEHFRRYCQGMMQLESEVSWGVVISMSCSFSNSMSLNLYQFVVR
jgi:hypothetical protein